MCLCKESRTRSQREEMRSKTGGDVVSIEWRRTLYVPNFWARGLLGSGWETLEWQKGGWRGVPNRCHNIWPGRVKGDGIRVRHDSQMNVRTKRQESGQGRSGCPVFCLWHRSSRHGLLHMNRIFAANPIGDVR